MPVIIAKTGMMLLAMLSMLMFSMAGITLEEMLIENGKVNTVDLELIKEEIEELIEDYTSFARGYMPQWLEDNEELKNRKPTEEDLSEFKQETLEIYINNDNYTDVDISGNTLDYMESKISDDDKLLVDYHRKYAQYVDVDREIIYDYLRNLIIDNN